MQCPDLFHFGFAHVCAWSGQDLLFIDEDLMDTVNESVDDVALQTTANILWYLRKLCVKKVRVRSKERNVYVSNKEKERMEGEKNKAIERERREKETK